MIAESGKPGSVFNMKQQFVEGNPYILLTAETAGNV